MAALGRALSNVLEFSRLSLLSPPLMRPKASILCSLGSFPSVHGRSFHPSEPVEGKYHYLAKKRKLRVNKKHQLIARFQRLDEEDKPTGCLLCPKRIDVDIDYKNARLLSQFVSPHTGRIYGKTLTGLCEKKQKEISRAIRRSRAMGFMPVTMKYLDYHTDPKLF